jgi:predicted RNase H-like nuclease (RuvC/YqgF family)
MTPEPISTISTSISTGISENFVVISGIVAAVAGIVWPVIHVIRKINSNELAAVKRNEAEITLYQQLKEQLEINKRELDEALRENRRLWDIIRDLEARLKRVEQIESNFEKLRRKLDEKDTIIRERDLEIDSLKEQLRAKEEKIRELEIRVAHLELLLEKKYEYKE